MAHVHLYAVSLFHSISRSDGPKSPLVHKLDRIYQVLQLLAQRKAVYK